MFFRLLYVASAECLTVILMRHFRLIFKHCESVSKTASTICFLTPLKVAIQQYFKVLHSRHLLYLVLFLKPMNRMLFAIFELPSSALFRIRLLRTVFENKKKMSQINFQFFLDKKGLIFNSQKQLYGVYHVIIFI